ncbi:MAG: 7TM diverse intracellular signaling domain-containing protein [Bacteroidota bacterium]|nr:7TM diverse intracellular signaling domain-containing protein [Bacteroidota bacterium]
MNAYSANAQSPVIFNGNKQLIVEKCSFVFDPSGLESFQSIHKNFISKKTIAGKLNLDHTDDIIWIKGILVNHSNVSELTLNIENPLIDSVDFFVVNDDIISTQHIYLNEPVTERKFRSTNFIFPFTLAPNKQVEIYFRIHNTELMLLPITVSTQELTNEDNDKRDLIYGIFIGVILVMIFYNLFVFISTRDKSYFYYVLYIFFIGFAQITLSGHTLLMFFGNHTHIFKYFIVIIPALSGVFAVVFIRIFLHTKRTEPTLDKGLLIILILYSLAAFFRLFGWFHSSSRMMDLTGIPGSILVYITAIRIYNKGLKSAIYFLFAWSIFIVGIILFILRNFNVLPFNNFTSYTLPFGAAVEVALLSFALADKINTLQTQKREKDKELLEAALENERLIREQNIILEQKVTERTLDLANSNNQLSTALTDLKDTQSQLVEQEKMASLGQLTAGIAHEINNPINFVTSNINPLKRDLNILNELFEQVEELCLSDKHADEKQKIIHQLKEEIDYGYLQEEMSFLIKGIDDGAHRTAEIVKGLRIFAHSDEDSMQRVDLVDGINSALIILNNQLGKIVVKQEFDTANNIDCYPGKLNQVFLNLLSNAIYAIKSKFGEAPGGEIIISSFSDNDYIYLKIADNGCGMSDEVQKKIFEPFFTTKPVGDGTGLGMSIVFKTIEIHKGTITINSKEGEGSIFEIKLLKVH